MGDHATKLPKQAILWGKDSAETIESLNPVRSTEVVGNFYVHVPHRPSYHVQISKPKCLFGGGDRVSQT